MFRRLHMTCFLPSYTELCLMERAWQKYVTTDKQWNTLSCKDTSGSCMPCRRCYWQECPIFSFVFLVYWSQSNVKKDVLEEKCDLKVCRNITDHVNFALLMLAKIWFSVKVRVQILFKNFYLIWCWKRFWSFISHQDWFRSINWES